MENRTTRLEFTAAIFKEKKVFVSLCLEFAQASACESGLHPSNPGEAVEPGIEAQDALDLVLFHDREVE